MTIDGTPPTPFVTHFLQVAKHSIATLDLVVRADLAASLSKMVEVAEQLLQVVFAQNGKCFAEMFVVQVRLVAPPDLPGSGCSPEEYPAESWLISGSCRPIHPTYIRGLLFRIGSLGLDERSKTLT